MIDAYLTVQGQSDRVLSSINAPGITRLASDLQVNQHMVYVKIAYQAKRFLSPVQSLAESSHAAAPA